MDIQSLGSNFSQSILAPGQAAPEKLKEEREIIQAVKALNRVELFGDQNELTYVLDPDLHRPVLRIVDRITSEVVRQIPADYVLQLARRLKRP
ncbi:MAG TPA: flagellar protein FlaG [Bryobacteraceae bacterium]|nr:flagellar protein FlaG [Bryobacteraceae bacterium]